MQDTLGKFTHEEIFTHFLYFEEKLRQNGKLTPKLKVTALQAQKYPLCYHSSETSSSSSFMNEQIITKMFEIIFNLEKEHNKERDEEDITHVYFSCHKEGHTTRNCSLVFSYKKKQNFKKIDAILAVSNRAKRKKKEEINYLNFVTFLLFSLFV
jgi:hypothetical protein